MRKKGLTRSSIIRLAAGSLAGLLATAARAELVLNFPLKGDSKLSRDASATLLLGATQILGAIQMAEIDRDKATTMLNEGRGYLEKAREMFFGVHKMAGNAPLNPEKMKLLNDVVARIQNNHKITIPKTMDELSKMAISEVNRFAGATKGMGFENIQQARGTTLIFSAAINRLLDVGVFVSELAETAD